jgi:hypothetical protein
MLRLQELEVEKERTAVVEASSSPLQATRSLASMMEPIRYGGWKRRPFYREESKLKEIDKDKDVYIFLYIQNLAKIFAFENRLPPIMISGVDYKDA